MRLKKLTGGTSNRTPVLDDGIVITGDVLVKLLGLRLLPVKVRLLISSTKLARDLGLDWWRDESSGNGGRGKKRSKAKSDSPAARPRSGKNGSHGQS